MNLSAMPQFVPPVMQQQATAEATLRAEVERLKRENDKLKAQRCEMRQYIIGLAKMEAKVATGDASRWPEFVSEDAKRIIR